MFRVILSLLPLVTLHYLAPRTEAEDVHVEISGYVAVYPSDRPGEIPTQLGTLDFLCTFVYDDAHPASVDGIFRRAVRDFRIDFASGSVLTAESGNIQISGDGRFNIRHLYDFHLPAIGDWVFNGNPALHLPQDGKYLWLALPTADELQMHFKPYYMWLNADNSCVLVHETLTVNSRLKPLDQLSIKMTGDAGPRIVWRAIPEETYRVFSSKDLQDFSHVATLTANTRLAS